jgi:hypothetical protein
VTLEYSTQQAVRDRLASWTPFRILQGIRVLHQRGYHRLRVWPGSTGASPWRVMVSYPDYVEVGGYSEMRTVNIPYAVGAGMEFADGEVTVATSPDAVADLVLRSLPMAGPTVDDPDYVSWFDTLMKIVDAVGLLPLAYGDYFDESGGWEIGWDSGIRYPTLLGHPRRERRALAGLSTRSQLAENPPVYGPRGADAVFVE